MYTKTDTKDYGIIENIHMATDSEQIECALVCMLTTDCYSFTYNYSISLCQLQKNGYGEWIAHTNGYGAHTARTDNTWILHGRE